MATNFGSKLEQSITRVFAGYETSILTMYGKLKHWEQEQWSYAKYLKLRTNGQA